MLTRSVFAVQKLKEKQANTVIRPEPNFHRLHITKIIGGTRANTGNQEPSLWSMALDYLHARITRYNEFDTFTFGKKTILRFWPWKKYSSERLFVEKTDLGETTRKISELNEFIVEHKLCLTVILLH